MESLYIGEKAVAQPFTQPRSGWRNSAQETFDDPYSA